MRYKQILSIDTQILRICGIQSVFGVYEGSQANLAFEKISLNELLSLDIFTSEKQFPCLGDVFMNSRAILGNRRTGPLFNASSRFI